MRTYKRKSHRGLTPPNIMLQSVRAVKIDKRALRATSREFGIPLMTLQKYCQKFSNEEITGANNSPNTIGGYFKMTIYDIPGIVSIALPLAATQNNITAGVRVSGISPFDRNIFPDSEFLPPYVTDRPNPNGKAVIGNEIPSTSKAKQTTDSSVDNELVSVQRQDELNLAIPSSRFYTRQVTPTDEILNQLSCSKNQLTPAEILKPLPKAAQEKTKFSSAKENPLF